MAAKKRKRRTDEEMIADLQEKIGEIKVRAATRVAKSSPATKKALAAIKALDQGLELAAEEGASLLRHALAEARKPLAEHLEGEGVKLPKARLPRGRKPKRKVRPEGD